jgi:transposase InsO family protein
MKRLLLGFAACASVSAPTPSASAMPGANPNALTDTDSSIVLVKGGLGHGGGHRGGRGHQYGFDLLNAFVIVRLDRRDLVWINVTANPTAEWVARQITEAFPWDEAPHYLIRDRDRIYGSVVARRLRAMGIRDKPTAPASPWQNGFAERLIGSIRRECVDHIIVLGEMHLRRVLKSYADYYNSFRTHRSLNKDAPVTRQIQRIGSIKSHAILGGLHHRYARV